MNQRPPDFSQPRSPQPATAAPQSDEIQKALAGDSAVLISFADRTGKSLATGKDNERLSVSQIRNVLDDIQRMRTYDPNRLQMLRPKLAYAAGRHGGKVKELQQIIDKAIQQTTAENFRHFKDLVEAIVGYHRYYGGK